MRVRFFALAALVVIAGVAQANDPNCYLRTMGGTISILGSSVDTKVQDSNIDPVSMSLVYDNETSVQVGLAWRRGAPLSQPAHNFIRSAQGAIAER